MNRRLIAWIGAAWIVSLVGVAVWAQGGAQGDLQRAPTVLAGQPVGEVITGDDIGFQRVAGQAQRGKIIGRLMIRIDGKWLEAEPVVGIVR